MGKELEKFNDRNLILVHGRCFYLKKELTIRYRWDTIIMTEYVSTFLTDFSPENFLFFKIKNLSKKSLIFSILSQND